MTIDEHDHRNMILLYKYIHSLFVTIPSQQTIFPRNLADKLRGVACFDPKLKPIHYKCMQYQVLLENVILNHVILAKFRISHSMLLLLCLTDRIYWKGKHDMTKQLRTLIKLAS